MQQPNVVEFERLVRAYLVGEVSWDVVHHYAIEMEGTDAMNFPHLLRQPLENLHIAFLTADERDDSQFRLERPEISKLVCDLDLAQAKQHGT